MRLATWNVNSLKARLPRVEDWIGRYEPDVLCVQETKLADDAFPLLTFQAMGYEAAHHGEGRWNGVAILSRVGLGDVRAGFIHDDDADPDLDRDARLLAATCAGVRVNTVYVPNGRSVDDDQYAYKLAWLARLRSHLETVSEPDHDVVVCGDINVAPDDRDVYDPEAFAGETHVTDAERQALADLGLSDVFRHIYDGDGMFSWWDYRAGNFHKGKGMRIDLVLASRSLAARTASVLIDRNARKGSKPSDHAPVVVDFRD